MKTPKIKKSHKLKEDSALLQHISDSSPGAIYQFKMDRDGHYSFTYVSNGFEQLTGVPKDLILNDTTSIFENVESEDFQKFTESITESANNMTQWHHKFRLKRKDLGKSIWVKGTSNPEKKEDGSILWNGILMDITENEELYENFIESSKRYKYAVKASDDAIWDWDLVTDKLYWSDGFEKILGTKLTEDKFTIQYWEKIIHPEDKERVVTSIHNAILTFQNIYWEETYRMVKENGDIVYVNDRGYIIHNKFDRPLRMVGAIKDVTDVKLAEIEKQKLLDDLIRRNEALEQFTYIVSHNLRAPVANILGLSQAVQDESLDETSKEVMTNHLLSAAMSLDNVLKDLNHILNTNMGVNLKKDIINFDNLHSQILQDLKHQIEKEQVEFITDFSESPNIKIVYNYIHNILLNLITNSIKFRSERKPVIRMHTSKDDKFIYLEYEDNGVGVDLDKFGHKIFGLYKVFHPDRKGKGMGLFMVKTQMDNLHGEITVSSKVGKGTKFYLKFNNLL
jgi:PAS domain S-box-containing protein